MRRLQGIISMIFLFAGYGACQESVLFVPKINEALSLDGKLDEASWSEAAPTSPFILNYPVDSLPASSPTEVKVVYNDQFIYIGAICKDSKEGDYVVQSLKRDFDFFENDAFEVIIDAFHDGFTGLAFAVNPYGVQRDGIIKNGGRKGVDQDWNALWYAEVFRDPVNHYWSVEMAIPFKSLRFSNKLRNWKVNFARNDIKTNEVSTWTLVPQSFDVASLAFCGKLMWEEAPPKPVSNISLNPYVAGIFRKDYNNTGASSNIEGQFQRGGDVKLALSSSLNLDLTVNPDFSQVEVDREIINLQRFEFAFPERRVFFQENSDLFSSLGNSRIRPFFSRRIGSFEDQLVPIQFGARLTGNLDANWRVGLMSVQTRNQDHLNLASQNYSVGVLQRKILKRSALTAFLINRQSTQGLDFNQKDFNRIGGFEFDFRSADSRWTGKAFAHYSINPGQGQNGLSYSSKLRYKNSDFSVFVGLDAAHENFNTDVGYVPRLYHSYNDTTYQLPYIHFRTNGYYRFFVKENSIINYWGPDLHIDWYSDQSNLNSNEYNVELGMILNFINTSEISLYYSTFTIDLLSEFTLDGLDRAFGNGNYPHDQLILKYDTGKRKRLFGQVKLQFGTAYLGKQFEKECNLNFRKSANLVLGLNYTNTRLIDFPQGFGKADFHLVGSNFEVSFNRNLFFTSLIQFNTQSQNFNINSRLNWRFKPLSDLFLVYTENYLTNGLPIKNRSLVLKLNYWLNL